MRLALSLLAASLLAARAAALDCTILAECDLSGACTGGGDRVAFDIRARGTDREGRPLYQIDYRGRSVTAVETATGVLVWAEGAGDSQRLTKGADGTAVWQRRLRQAPPRQVTRRMQCRGAMQ